MENLDGSNKNVSLSLIAEYEGSESDSDDTESRSNDNTCEDSDTVEHKQMVLKNNLINACAHGPPPPGQSNVLDDIETSRHMIIDSSESGLVEYEVTEYRDIDSDSSSSDSSVSDVDSVKDVEEISSGDENEGGKSDKTEVPKVAGELGLEDLPPIEDLAISLPAQETIEIGTIVSIVDRLVIVRAFPETPAVDLDSVLFLDNGSKTLGRVFDVFGPVTEPHYCVRFNTAEHARSRGATAGARVCIAPRHSAHTNFVFLHELMKLKGSDASWLNDVEPPSHQVEYSDDEEERRANKARKEQRQNKPEEDGETSKTRKPDTRRNQRPSESSSRFGSGPSRGRNPFSAGSRRNPNCQRFNRPWNDTRTPPPHGDPNMAFGFGPPMFPPPFSSPPFMPPQYQFGGSPQMGPPMNMMPFGPNMPPFAPPYCGPTQWVNNGPPPPPGT